MSATATPRRALAATSALLIGVDRAVDLVLAFAARPEGHDLAVAVTPEQAGALAERIGAEAEHRGVALEPDIALVECADLAALRTMLAGADRVIDSGCAALGVIAAPAGEGVDAGLRPPLDVVLVNTYPSQPARHGGGMRVGALWAGMPADVGARAVVLGHCGDPERRVSLTRARLGHEHQVPFWRGFLHAVAGLTERLGASADDLAAALTLRADDAFGRALAGAVAERADALVLVHPFLVRQAVAAAPGLPLVYDAQNVEADLKAGLYGPDAAGREAVRLVAELEAEACARAVAVICCTEEDRERMRERYGVPAERLHVVPNGVALDDAVYVPWGARDPRAPRCVFTGSGHGPNVEAAETVLAAAGALPEVGFDLVGDVGAELGPRVLPANVVRHGRVSAAEKQRLFAAATLALNPMRTGSGSNLKVVDYAAAGLPLLTTTVGARGFGAFGGAFAVCDAEPAGWAPAITAALGEDWAARTAHARAVAERAYDWRALAARYADVLHDALQRHPR